MERWDSISWRKSLGGRWRRRNIRVNTLPEHTPTRVTCQPEGLTRGFLCRAMFLVCRPHSLDLAHMLLDMFRGQRDHVQESHRSPLPMCSRPREGRFRDLLEQLEILAAQHAELLQGLRNLAPMIVQRRRPGVLIER